MQPPQLSNTAVHYPDCCSSLSIPLISKLASLLPPDPALILSIGSGTGLLEALLLQHQSTINLRTVEVTKDVNKYMPEDLMRAVNGSWGLCHLAKEAAAWMFVYPRDVGLIKKYAQAFGQGSASTIIWIGPVADLQEVEGCLGPLWKQEVLKDCGLSEYESMVLWSQIDLGIS